MAQNTSDIIEFNILIRAEASGETPDLINIERFRPDPEDIEKCRRWLIARKVTCYATDFGLACSTSHQVFESLFLTRLERLGPEPGKPPWRFITDPVPPSEIADYIEEVTVSAPPVLF